jgi:hypothetical protein
MWFGICHFTHLRCALLYKLYPPCDFPFEKHLKHIKHNIRQIKTYYKFAIFYSGVKKKKKKNYYKSVFIIPLHCSGSPSPFPPTTIRVIYRLEFGSIQMIEGNYIRIWLHLLRMGLCKNQIYSRDEVME